MDAHVARPHRPADLSLLLSLAVLPGAAIGPGRADTAMATCPALRRETAATSGQEQLQTLGYRLLEAGRVEDAVAFFQLHVAHASGHPARTDRGST